MAGPFTYSLVFKNNSNYSGSAALYQTDPGIGVPGVMSLAWFTKFTQEGAQAAFRWAVDYDFVWAQTGILRPGVIFAASQTWHADLATGNAITLAWHNTCSFQNQGPGPQQGTLYIAEDITVPTNQVSAGIGMSGAGTFAVQAMPKQNLAFTPHPKYWIAFGYYTAGQVLDVAAIANPGAILFPPGVYSMSATLNLNNSWTIQPT